MEQTIHNLVERIENALYQEDFKKADELAQQILKLDPEHGKAYYYRLLAAFEAKDFSRLPASTQLQELSYFQKAMDHGDDALREHLQFLLKLAGISETRKKAEEALKKQDYQRAYDLYKELKDTEKMQEVRYHQASHAMGKPDYKAAVQYYTEAGDYADSREKAAQAEKLHAARSEFIKETYIHGGYLKQELSSRCHSHLKKYTELSRKADKSTFTHGTLYGILSVLLVLAAAAMVFDRHVSNEFLYLVWGVSLTVMLHIAFDWDFGFIKSILTGVVLTAAPLALRWFMDEAFQTDDLAPIITVAVSGIIFIRNIFREINYRQGKQAAKQKVAVRIQYLDPHIRDIRAELVEKYSRKAPKELVQKWVNNLKLDV